MIRNILKALLNWQPTGNKLVSHSEKSKALILENAERDLKGMGLLSPKIAEEFKELREKWSKANS